MIRVLKNWRDAECLSCGAKEDITSLDGRVFCSFCGSQNLVDKWQGGMFTPLWCINSRNEVRKRWGVATERRSENIGGNYAS